MSQSMVCTLGVSASAYLDVRSRSVTEGRSAATPRPARSLRCYAASVPGRSGRGPSPRVLTLRNVTQSQGGPDAARARGAASVVAGAPLLPRLRSCVSGATCRSPEGCSDRGCRRARCGQPRARAHRTACRPRPSPDTGMTLPSARAGAGSASPSEAVSGGRSSLPTPRRSPPDTATPHVALMPRTGSRGQPVPAGRGSAHAGRRSRPPAACHRGRGDRRLTSKEARRPRTRSSQRAHESVAGLEGGGTASNLAPHITSRPALRDASGEHAHARHHMAGTPT